VLFRDLFYQSLGTSGGGDPIQLGAGTAVSSMPSLFTQGSVNPSGVATDVAIMQDGFFIVQKNGVTSYTRAGNFTQDPKGFLVTDAGEQVMGYASSQVDQRKVGRIALAIQVAFQELGVFPASNSAIPIDSKEPVPFNTVQAIENAERTAALGRIVPPPKGVLAGSEDGDLSSLRQELEQALTLEIQRNEVVLRTTPDGLVISLREIGFFDSGSAQVKATSLSAFGRIAVLLSARKYRIRIEGHTDNVPIHNARFSDNWELSTARSTELVRLLIVKYGLEPERLSAAGYAEYHPVASNRSPETRAQNRRVDVVILGKPPAVLSASSEHVSEDRFPAVLAGKETPNPTPSPSPISGKPPAAIPVLPLAESVR
jgi:chemotaxis protein MotB